jgi:hypothetical protein
VDDTGFPRALLGLRDEVTRRGGKIVPDGHRWVIYHDDPNLVRIYVYFHPQGSIEAAVSWHEIGFYPREQGLAEFESDIVSVLDGGYREYVLLDENDVLSGSGFDLRPPPLDVPPTFPHEEGLRVVWWRYRAWPAAH